MAATGWLIRRRLQRRWLALLPLVLIVGLGGAAAFVSLGAAERTANAYSRYLQRADVGDIVLNPSDLTDDLDEVIRTLPGVTSVTSDVVFSASLDEGAPRTVAELEFNQTQVIVIGSVDGRHATMDRPAVAEGRLLDGPRQAIINPELADSRGVEVGDVLPVSFWSFRDQLLEDGDTMVSPLGVEHVEVVAVGMLLPEMVLPDDLFPVQAMIVSPDVAGRYQFVPEAPPPGASADEVVAALLPEDSAALFWDYSLELADGDAGVAAVRDAVRGYNAELRAEAEAGEVPLDDGFADDPVAALAAADPQELNVATTTAQERERVERSVQPIVTALVVFGVAAAVVTAIMAGLAGARELRRTERDQLQWWQLGLPTPDRTSVAAASLLVAVVAGLGGALAVAWWLSPIAPVGSVRSVDPTPGRQLAGWVWLAAFLLAVVLIAGIVVLAFRSVRQIARAPARAGGVPTVQRLMRGSARPEVTEGIRSAYGRRGSGLVVASGAATAAVFLAAVVFATSLSALLSTPRSYGWPWDLGVIVGLGWGGADLDAVAATLDQRDDVEGWTGLGFMDSVTLDGAPEFAVVGVDHASPVDLAIIEGRLPAGEGEVALGSRTAADLGIGVGDEVALGGDQIEPGVATVTGRVVFPALGPLGGERAAPGSGMLLPSAILDEQLLAFAIGFVGVELAPDADPEVVRSELRDDLAAWETVFEEPLPYTEPVRPAEIVDTQSMRTVPLLVGGLLALAASIGLAFAVVVSVRSRRRELATVRALGFTGRQIRDSIRVQTVATMVAALVVGAPIGIAVGRVAWRAFAAQLGVVTDPTMPGLWILATAAGSVAIALTAAAIPARLAAAAQPATVLRSE